MTSERRARFVSDRIASFVVARGEIERSAVGAPLPHIELSERLAKRLPELEPSEQTAGVIYRRGDSLTVEVLASGEQETSATDLAVEAFPELDLARDEEEPWNFQ